MGFIKRPGATLGILTGINGLNYIDRYVTAAVLPLVITDLKLTDGQAGWLQGVFIFIYAFACPVMGWLGDRGRRLPLATAGVLVFCAATFGAGFAGGFAALLAARALVGVGEASYAIVTPSIIADLYPADRRSRALAIFYAAIPVGSALSYMIGGAVGAAFGWRAAFFLTGGPGILLALSLLLLAEPQRGRYDQVAGVMSPASALSLGASLRALWSRKSFLVNTAAQTIYTFALGGLAAWVPTYFVRERNMPLSRASFLFGLCLVLAGFIGTLLGGQLGDRLSRRSPTAPYVSSGIALLLAFPTMLIGVLASRPEIFWPAMFVALMLLFFITGPLNAAMTNVLPSDLRARGFAAYSVAIHVLGDGPSPPLIGMVSDAVGLRVPVLVATTFFAISGIILLAGRHTLARDLVGKHPMSKTIDLDLSLEFELEVAHRAALAAADLVRRYHGTKLDIERKPGDEPVTIADRQASDLILADLVRAFPHDAILSEEVPDSGARLAKDRVWMVDPIDGTSDFIAGDTGFCVMIGLNIEGRPRLGVLAMPATGDSYAGIVGQGGWKQSADGTRVPLQTSTLPAPPGIRLVASKTHRTGDVDVFRRALGIEDEVNVGSIGVKVAMVADARRDLYVYPGSRTKIWDTCAPEAVLLAAGGRITDVHGQPIVYTQPELTNRGGIVASNGPLHDLVLETLEPLVKHRKLPG